MKHSQLWNLGSQKCCETSPRSTWNPILIIRWLHTQLHSVICDKQIFKNQATTMTQKYFAYPLINTFTKKHHKTLLFFIQHSLKWSLPRYVPSILHRGHLHHLRIAQSSKHFCIITWPFVHCFTGCILDVCITLFWKNPLKSTIHPFISTFQKKSNDFSSKFSHLGFSRICLRSPNKFHVRLEFFHTKNMKQTEVQTWQNCS